MNKNINGTVTTVAPSTAEAAFLKTVIQGNAALSALLPNYDQVAAAMMVSSSQGNPDPSSTDSTTKLPKEALEAFLEMHGDAVQLIADTDTTLVGTVTIGGVPLTRAGLKTLYNWHLEQVKGDNLSVYVVDSTVNNLLGILEIAGIVTTADVAGMMQAAYQDTPAQITVSSIGHTLFMMPGSPFTAPVYLIGSDIQAAMS